MNNTFPGVELFDAFLEGFDVACVVAGGGLADFKGDAALVDDIFHGLRCARTYSPTCSFRGFPAGLRTT